MLTAAYDILAKDEVSIPTNLSGWKYWRFSFSELLEVVAQAPPYLCRLKFWCLFPSMVLKEAENNDESVNFCLREINQSSP